MKKHNGITYLDTSGLSDTKLRKQAAEAITAALKKGGTYQVFFVISLESGRFHPEDVTTIKLVLESTSDIKHFSLILNKLSTTVLDRLLDENAKNLRTMVTELLVQINFNDNPPTVLLLEHKFNLFDKENKIIDWDELNEFVEKAPSITINSNCVGNIKDDPYSFKEALEALKCELDELRRDNERLRRLQEKTEANYKRLMHRDLEDKLEKGLLRHNTNKEETQPLQEEKSTKETTQEASKKENIPKVSKILVFYSLFNLLHFP